MLKLYSYFRSSASYRVRCALHWKELSFEYLPVHLLREGGDQNKSEYRKVNPMGHVPALNHDGFVVAESVAIVEYLDAIFPNKPLFPKDAKARAQVMQICELINSGIQPLQNQKVTAYLKTTCQLSKESSDGFVAHWIYDGLKNLNNLLERSAGTYCCGGTITAADCFLVPQCFSAQRFGVDISPFPIIERINSTLTRLEPFQRAHPQKQPDFTP